MRVIAGSARGRPIAGPKHDGLRPTSDRTRQVLFDLLGQRFDGGAVLDLYCGTGALAIEALSRGAATALCVDSDPRALALVEANAAALGFAAQVATRRADLGLGVAEGDARGFGTLPVTPRRLIFADPPYEGAEPGLHALLRWVGAFGILAPDGVLVIETSRHSSFDGAASPGLSRRQPRRLGDTVLHLYESER